jgi:two-component system cell cycle sensor histidine kinase/response regulator CckA
MILRQDRGSPRDVARRAWCIAGHGARQKGVLVWCRNAGKQGAIAMSDRADRPAPQPIWPSVMSLQPMLLGGLGVVVGIGALFLSGQDGAFILSAISGGCLGAAVLLAGRGVWAERRRAQALAETVARIRNDPAATVLTDAEGRIIALNPVAEARMGEQAEAHVTQAFSALLPNASTVVARQTASLGTSDAAHETIPTPRGHVRLFVSRVTGGILWRLDEIREPHEAGEGIGLPMMMVSHADTILSTNEAMRELLGSSATELGDVFPEQPLVPGRRTRMRSGAEMIEVVPIILAARDGRREVYAVPGLAEPPAASVAARAFESLPVASLHIGADGQVLASNRHAQALLGIGPHEGGHLSALVEGLGRPIRDWVADTVAERIPTRSEVVRARRRGDERFLQIALSRITDATGPSLLAVMHDATELKSLEQQFVQSQKMQAVGELAGGVAHDFNNLLTAITGHCDLLLLRHDQGDPEYGDLVQISQNANRAASLVGQLLAFSRQQKLKLEIIDLRDTMADLMHLLNRLVGEKIKLSLDHDPGLLPIRVDRRQFDQVIMNLVVNARDAMAEGGEVRVETRVIHLRDPLRRDNAVVPPGNYVTVAVMDDGHGIPATKLGRIFEPFFTTKEVGKGTGLGLSMAYGIIKQSGGYIFVDSEVEVGSTFTIYIPVYDEPAQTAMSLAAPEADTPAGKTSVAPAPSTDTPPPVAEGQPAPEGQGVVLLVEDEAPVRAFAARALQLRGYTVVEAGDAEAALETLRRGDTRFDLFVTDVVMPGMDGPTWVRQALRDHPDVKVVFVSGYSEEDIGEMSADIPNSVFLPKPFTLSDLTETVARQLH